MNNAYSIVDQFEKRVAEFAGSRYAVAVDSGTSALRIALDITNVKGYKVDIPRKTYCSVPMAIIQAGGIVVFTDERWTGQYELISDNESEPTIFDSAKRFKRNMYCGGIQCLSFHVKKHINIGRGGMLLTEDKVTMEIAKELRYDGRQQEQYGKSPITRIGYNAYMTPEQAARGLMLMDIMPKDGFDDLIEDYPDLTDERLFPVFKDHPQVVR